MIGFLKEGDPDAIKEKEGDLLNKKNNS